MAAITDREQRMMLSVFEAEAENARLIEEKWRDTPSKGYEDGPAALADERAFARGVSHQATAALEMLKSIINA